LLVHCAQSCGASLGGRQASTAAAAARSHQVTCSQHLASNGRKYDLYLFTSEKLVARGMPAGKAKLLINAYPVLVLSSE